MDVFYWRKAFGSWTAHRHNDDLYSAHARSHEQYSLFFFPCAAGSGQFVLTEITEKKMIFLFPQQWLSESCSLLQGREDGLLLLVYHNRVDNYWPDAEKTKKNFFKQSLLYVWVYGNLKNKYIFFKILLWEIGCLLIQDKSMQFLKTTYKQMMKSWDHGWIVCLFHTILFFHNVKGNLIKCCSVSSLTIHWGVFSTLGYK